MAWIEQREGRTSRAYRVCYRDPDGQKRSRTFSRRADANQFFAEIERQLSAGTYLSPQQENLTFAEFSADWLNTLGHLAPGSRQNVDGIVRNHLWRAFGEVEWRAGRLEPTSSMTLRAIRPSDVRGLINDLQRDLAPGTVKKVHQVLSQILDDAVNDGLIPRNPARGAKLPRSAPSEMRFLNVEAFEDLVSAIDHRYAALVETAAFTGMRFGELAALSPADVDLDQRRITVRASLSDVNGTLHRRPPKNGKVRGLAIPQRLIPSLEPLLTGEHVFTAPAGGPLRRRLFRTRQWLPAVEACGQDGLRFHDLRHTHASWLIRQGVHPKALAERLGHSTVRLSLDRYGHLFPDIDQTIADQLDALGDAPRPSPADTAVAAPKPSAGARSWVQAEDPAPKLPPGRRLPDNVVDLRTFRRQA